MMLGQEGCGREGGMIGPITEAEAVIELARREMCAAYELEPPLEVDAGAGLDWLSAK